MNQTGTDHVRYKRPNGTIVSQKLLRCKRYHYPTKTILDKDLRDKDIIQEDLKEHKIEDSKENFCKRTL